MISTDAEVVFLMKTSDTFKEFNYLEVDALDEPLVARIGEHPNLLFVVLHRAVLDRQ